MVQVKAGVQFDIIAPAGAMILAALRATARAYGLPLTITSACDGTHSGPHDPHKLGEAYDVRSHDLPPDMRGKVLGTVMQHLGWDAFYGFLEDKGTTNEHFHIQAAKGRPFDVEDWLKTV